MTYATIQTAVAGRIKQATGFYYANVSEGDYSIFSKGLKKAAVLRKGTSQSRRLSVTANSAYPVESVHTVNVEVYVPYRTNSKTTRANLIIETNRVVQELRKWPDLNSTSGVLDSSVTDVAEPEEGQFAGSEFRFWRQVIAFRVKEVETVTVS